MATCSRILAWKIPLTEEPIRLQSMGSQSLTWLSDWVHMHAWMIATWCKRRKTKIYLPTGAHNKLFIPLKPWFPLGTSRLFSQNYWGSNHTIEVGHVLATAAAGAAKSLQSWPTLCDPIDGSPPGSPIPGILQERKLEWIAISFSNAWKRKWSHSDMSDPSRPPGLQPTRLLHPWDFTYCL